MKKLLIVLAMLLAMPFAIADTYLGVDLWSSEDIHADINLNGNEGSSYTVNGDALATKSDLPSMGQGESNIFRKIIEGINAVDEKNHEGTPLLFTKTGLNDYSRAVGWALYEHYVPRNEFYPIAKTVEYNTIRLKAIETLLEQKFPGDYCDIKRDLMEEYGLHYVSCVNAVGEVITYENPTLPDDIYDEHGCFGNEEFCERTQECFVPGVDYCDGLIVVNNRPEPEPECLLDEDCEEGFICEDEICVEQLIGGETDEYDCLIAAGFTWNETEEWCVKEWLEVDDPERYQCLLDEDCEEGFACEGGICVAEVELLEDGEVCLSNDECASGMCPINTNVCAGLD